MTSLTPPLSQKSIINMDLMVSPRLFYPLHPIDEHSTNAEPDGSTQQNQVLGEHFVPDQNQALPPSIPPHHASCQPQNMPPANNADAQAMAPALKRGKKAKTLRPEDWEPYKARVLELHSTQKKTLDEVRKIIEKEFGFVAKYAAFPQAKQNQGSNSADSITIQDTSVSDSNNPMGQGQERQVCRNVRYCQKTTTEEDPSE
jgi:hypothetical protein